MNVKQAKWMNHLAFSLPKRRNAPEEYEDAFACDCELGRFALADGASESSFAEVWARLLVEQFVQEPLLELSAWPGWARPGSW